jgi:hypothetical protein
MLWGGKRAGAGRKTDPTKIRNKNCKSVYYRIDDSTAKKFAEHCKLLRVPQNAVLEGFMKEWASDLREEIRKAREQEIKKAHHELKLKAPRSPDNLKDLNKKRADHKRKLALAEYLAEHGLALRDLTGDYRSPAGLDRLAGF